MLKSLLYRVKWVGSHLQSLFLLIVRLYWGYQFVLTGLGKFFGLGKVAGYFATLQIPFPDFNAYLVASVELICGFLLMVGLFSRLAAIPLLITMAVAYLTASRKALLVLLSDLNPQLFFSEAPFLFGLAALLIFIFGPGKISLDHFLFKKDY